MTGDPQPLTLASPLLRGPIRGHAAGLGAGRGGESRHDLAATQHEGPCAQPLRNHSPAALPESSPRSQTAGRPIPRRDNAARAAAPPALAPRATHPNARAVTARSSSPALGAAVLRVRRAPACAAPGASAAGHGALRPRGTRSAQAARGWHGGGSPAAARLQAECALQPGPLQSTRPGPPSGRQRNPGARTPGTQETLRAHAHSAGPRSLPPGCTRRAAVCRPTSLRPVPPRPRVSALFNAVVLVQSIIQTG